MLIEKSVEVLRGEVRPREGEVEAAVRSEGNELLRGRRRGRGRERGGEGRMPCSQQELNMMWIHPLPLSNKTCTLRFCSLYTGAEGEGDGKGGEKGEGEGEANARSTSATVAQQPNADADGWKENYRQTA